MIAMPMEPEEAPVRTPGDPVTTPELAEFDLPPSGAPAASPIYRWPADYQPRDLHWGRYVGVAALLLVAGFAGLAVGGPVGEFLSAGLEVLPFALLAFLAYAGLRRPGALAAAFGWHGLVFLATAGFTLLMVVAAAGEGGRTAAAFRPAAAVLAFNTLAVVVAFLALLPEVRRRVAGRLPIDPDSWVHAFALSLVSGATILFLGQLVATGGKPVILTMIQRDPRQFEELSRTILFQMLYGFIWMVPATVVAVGYPVMRSFPAALRRLGLVAPTRRQVVGGTLLALALVGVGWLLDLGIGGLWGAMGWPVTDAKAFERLLAGAINPVGAVVIGVTAGVGEELAIRGALQPRLGIWLPNLFFTSIHAFQYGFDGLLSVFLVGLVLGVVRARSNTSTSAIVHGVYDFVLVMLTYLGVGP